jgi:hypothetical protein
MKVVKYISVNLINKNFYLDINLEYFNFLIAYSTISCSLITRLIIDFELKSNAAEIKLAIVDIRIPI